MLERNRALLDAGLRIELPRVKLPPGDGLFIASETFDLDESPFDFDFAIASSLFMHLPFNSVARCIVSVVARLTPGGSFFATYFDSADPTRFEPVTRASGLVTYADREPFHYSVDLIRTICTAVGATVEPLDDRTHPRGESVLHIRKAR